MPENPAEASYTVSHLEKTVRPETEASAFPIEIETKVVNFGSAADMGKRLLDLGAKPVVPRRMLDDRRFEWEEKGKASPARINPGYFKSSESLQKALVLMGFELEKEENGKILAKPLVHMPKRTVRVRSEREKTFFAVKEKRKSEADRQREKIDHRKEVEVEVFNEHEIIEFLHNAGLMQDSHRQKFRTTYKLNGCLVEINEPPGGINPWLEIEGKNDRQILKVIALLGFKQEQVVSMSDREYLQSKGLTPEQAGHLLFKDNQKSS